jgi:hypothetical protein
MPAKKKRSDDRLMPFPIRLEPVLRAKLQALADADRRTLSNYILKILDEHAQQAAKPDRTPMKGHKRI